MKLALSTLCENPRRPTGLTTLFHEFVSHALALYPDVEWVVFAGPEMPWLIESERVTVCRQFPSNEDPVRRLWADHVGVGPKARALGADALLTVGFMPLRAPLPVVMHVFTVHHQSQPWGLRSWYRRLFVQRGLRRALLVVANSDWTLGELKRGATNACAAMISSPEGVQHERFHARPDRDLDAAARNALQLPDEYLFWSSNFYPYKRAELALAAYAQLPAELKRRFPFVLAGGNWSGGLDRARAAAERLDVAAHVRFLGWIDDRWLPSCYRCARAHLLSTAEETFGRSVLEALACGCPNIVQDLPVLREVAGDAAVYADYADPRSASAALIQVLTDEPLCARLRERGLERAQTYGFERLTRERVTAVRQALAQHRLSR